MVDFRFSEIVTNVQKMNAIRSENDYRALCSSCGNYAKVDKDEFELTLISDETLEYVVKMRAWNCCHEGEEPLDGHPERPESYKLWKSS